MNVDPFKLNWGNIFTESYNTTTKTATVIYNLNFELASNRNNIFYYTIGHINWVYKNLPVDSFMDIIFDLRGQQVSPFDIYLFEEKVKENLCLIEKELKVTFNFKQ